MKQQPLLQLKPRVSVIVTNFNYEMFVEAAIRSVLSQTYDNYECIIVDDCSTDNSFAVINRVLIELNDDRFRAIRLGQNLGQMAAMKAGLENTSGELVSFLDSDDILLPTMLQRHIEAHLNPAYSAGMTASDTIQIEKMFHTSPSSEGINLGSSPPDQQYHFVKPSPHWPAVAMSSLMFRRSTLELIMPEQTNNLRIHADYYVGMLTHLITGTITIDDSLSYFRIHRNNSFNQSPALGGTHRHGAVSAEIQEDIERQIVEHTASHVSVLKPVIGSDNIVRIIRSYTPPRKIYRRLKPFPAAQALFGKPLKYRFKYKILYRILGKK